MKTAVIFVLIVTLAFFGIYLLTKTSTNSTGNNFLTPTPTENPVLNSSIKTTPIPTTAESDRISATMATIKTAKGNIEIELYPTEAPKTVTNFATHAKDGYYNNLTFHRVESWVIQGGDPNGNGTGGESIYGPTFEDEITPSADLYKTGYVRGIVAMANRGPNTNGSQFFIIKTDTPLDPAYTIFGKVTSGMDVVDKIAVGDKILGIDVQ